MGGGSHDGDERRGLVLKRQPGRIVCTPWGSLFLPGAGKLVHLAHRERERKEKECRRRRRGGGGKGGARVEAVGEASPKTV